MTRDRQWSRRAALALGASALAGLAGCSALQPSKRTPTTERPTRGQPSPRRPSPSAPRVPYARQFGSVRNVASLGADTSGKRPVNDVLTRAMGDDTLLYLPEGRYLLEDTLAIHEFTNFGIVGRGATIVPASGSSNVLFSLGRPGRASGLVVDGLTFDFRAPNTGGRPLFVKVDDGLLVRDVTVRGSQDVDSDTMRFDVTSPSGSGLVERMRLPDGARPETGSVGCLVGGSNQGDLTFKDCHIAGFPNNGLYAEPPAGRIEVIGGRYENSNVANVRVGGNGLVRGVHVRCDRAIEGFGNMRGIRLPEGAGTVVENCVVEFLEVTGSDGAIVLAADMNAATIRNTRVTIDTHGIAAILAKPPSGTNADQSLHCENVTIEGSASDVAAVRVDGRDGCVLDGMTITQTGSNRDGIEFAHSVDNVVRNSRITVTDDPLVLVDAKATTTNVYANDRLLTNN